jgi:hypothetical protein
MIDTLARKLSRKGFLATVLGLVFGSAKFGADASPVSPSEQRFSHAIIEDGEVPNGEPAFGLECGGCGLCRSAWFNCSGGYQCRYYYRCGDTGSKRCTGSVCYSERRRA